MDDSSFGEGLTLLDERYVSLTVLVPNFCPSLLEVICELSLRFSVID